MKIAIAAKGNCVSDHFGHCEGFFIYEKKAGKIFNSYYIKNPGHRPGFLPLFLKEKKIDVVITGGMGVVAKELFKENGVDLLIGASGKCSEVIEKYLKGDLKLGKNICTEEI